MVHFSESREVWPVNRWPVNSASAPVEVKLGSKTNHGKITLLVFSMAEEILLFFFKVVKATEPSVLFPQDHGKGMAFSE